MNKQRRRTNRKGVNVARQRLARSKRTASRRLFAEQLEDRRLLTTIGDAGDYNSYHNYIVPADVNGDTYLSPRDALSVISELNSTGAGMLPDSDNTGERVDTNGDRMLSPVDALLVINALNDAEGYGDGVTKVVAMTLELQNPDGSAIVGNRVQSGSDFRIQVSVQDLRPSDQNPTGVFTAFMDIGYSNNLVSTDYATEPDTLTELFTVGGTDPSAFPNRVSFQNQWTKSAQYPEGDPFANPWRWLDSGDLKSRDEDWDPDFTPDEFDEIGSFSPVLTNFGNDIVPMMHGILTAQLDYDNPGTITFAGNPADAPFSDVFFSNARTDEVLPNQIAFNEVLVEIFKPVYARDDEASTAEDTALTIAYATNDALDTASTGTLALQSFTQPANGTVTHENGQFVYTPDDDYNNDSGTPDSFTYTMTDGLGNTDMATVTVTVTAVNDPPVANPDSETVNEDEGPYLFDVLDNDTPGPATATDEIGQTLTLTSVGIAGSSSQGGTVVIEANEVKYTPALNFFGTDTFTYVVQDSDGASSIGSVTVTVENTNDDPTAVNDTFGVDPLILEDLDGAAFVELDVVANDQIAPDVGETLTVDQVGEEVVVDVIVNPGVTAQGGTVALNGGTVVHYTPPADFNGIDTFSYRVSDGNGGFDFANVTVTVTAVNDKPIPDDAPLFAGARIIDTDLSSDLDVLVGAKAGPPDEVEAIFINQIVTQPSLGTLEISADNDYFIYTPNVGVIDQTDTFQYTIIDEFGAVSDVATASVTIEPLILPYARDDRADVSEDASDAPINVQVNDLFNEGTGITREFHLVVSIVNDVITTTDGPLATAHGSVVIVGDQVEYTPDADYFGEDTFEYVIDDDVADSLPSVGMVRVNVLSVNDAPTAGDDDLTAAGDHIQEDTPTVVSVLGNDAAGPANELEAIVLNQVVSGPSDGTVEINPDGLSFTYSPDANYYGSDSFTYNIRDAFGAVSNTATVNLVVDNVNDAPTALDDYFPSILEDSTNNVLDVMLDDWVGVVNTNDGADSISLLSLGQPSQGGSVTIVGDVVHYTPKADFFGTETFTYTIIDSGTPGLTDTGLVTVEVANVNDPPQVLNEDGSGVNQDRLMALKDFVDQELIVLANDSIAPDINEVLTLKELIGQDEFGVEVRGTTVTTKYGTASIAGDNMTVIYTPNDGFVTVGSDYDSFGYVVQDGNGGEADGLAEIDVIDAVPSDISGVAYIDANGDGVQQPEELTLAGIEVTLTGTNIRSADVNVTVETDVNGVFLFSGILPTAAEDVVGYSIAAEQARYLNDGIDSIADTLEDADYDPGDVHNDRFSGIQLGVWGSSGRAAENYAFGENGLASSYIKLTQYLASTRNGMMIATDGLGDTFWFSIMEGWEGVTSASFEFSGIPAAGSSDNSGLATATLTVNGQTRELNYYTHFDFAGDPRDGGCVVFLKGSAADLGFDLGLGDLTMAAEGELPFDAQELELLAAGNAAQYREGVDAIFGSNDWA